MLKRILNAIFGTKEKYYVGVITNTVFTFGSRGQQLTTISGDIYWTWWNAFDKDWVIGDTVTFKTRKVQPGVIEAYDIHKAGAV